MLTTSPLWVDTDCGLDDALALLYLVAAGVPPAGVSSVAGNTSARQAADNAAGVLRLAGVVAPVTIGRGASAGRGHHGPDGLGDTGLGDHAAVSDGDAVERLVEHVQRNAGTTLLMLGPVTNLAAALDRDPSLPRRLRAVVLVAGAPAARTDTNTALDAAAMREVIRRLGPARRLTVVTLHATGSDPIRAASLARLRNSTRFDGHVGRLVDAISRYRADGGTPGIVPHDALAAVVLRRPEVVTEVRHRTVVVDGDRLVATGRGPVRWVTALRGAAARLVTTLL